MFCAQELVDGAVWVSGERHAICKWCVLSGEFGKLIGDALESHGEIVQALEATEKHAYRSLVLAREWKERERELAF